MAAGVVHIHAPGRRFAEVVAAALPGRRCEIWDDEADVLAGIGAAEVVIAASLPAGAAGRAVRLRRVHALGVGVDALVPGLAPAVEVVRVTGVSEAAVSEHAWALLLALARQIPLAVAQQQQRVWRPFPARRLAGATLAVLGLGAIGGRVAAAAAGFAVRVIGTRRRTGAVAGVDAVLAPEATAEALAAADFVVVALPRTPATRGLLDAAMLARMRPGACLVVVSRGGIVDEAALVERLRDGALAGAALDVAAEEPLSGDSPLWSAPNLLLTPHVGGWSSDYARRVAAAVAADLERIDRGERPAGLVDRAHGY